MEEKLQKLQTTQEEQTIQINKSIKDTVETETTQKMQLISEKVAKCVTGQLISVIKTLIAKTNTSTNKQIKTNNSVSSCINDNITMEQREKQPLKGNKYKQSTSTTNNMLIALSTIKTKKGTKAQFMINK